MESHLYDYYGWNPYWSSGLHMGGYTGSYWGGMMAEPPLREAKRRAALLP